MLFTWSKLCAILTAALALMLAGCGNGEATATGAAPPAKAQPATNAQQNVVEQPPAPVNPVPETVVGAPGSGLAGSRDNARGEARPNRLRGGQRASGTRNASGSARHRVAAPPEDDPASAAVAAEVMTRSISQSIEWADSQFTTRGMDVRHNQ